MLRIYPVAIYTVGKLPPIIFITFLDYLMFHQVFLSPQVKRCEIISDEHGIYELPHELQTNLTLRILEN